ncbi:MAG: DUF3375 domain-containing protein [Pseudomonadota bacterium]
MEDRQKQRLNRYMLARRENPAWRLLASPTAPSVLMSLQRLFDSGATESEGIELEFAHELLAEGLQSQSNNNDLTVDSNDFALAARRELRQWIRKGLIIERQGRIWATDALQKAISFVNLLDSQMMTSTASRLLTVQREIEQLEVNLNPNAERREQHLQRQIQSLQAELERVKKGEFKVLTGSDAVEGIREVYNLASSLKSDFRRVEDSYRDADKQLRESIISEEQHRGEVVDKLLNTHDELLDTAEGQVFHSFHQQLRQEVQLEDMSERLKTILQHPLSRRALNRQQQSELRWLKSHLVDESATVIRARARGERDVKGFLETGLAVEHHRVGQLLKSIFQVAVELDWDSAKTRRCESPVKPVGIAFTHSPLLERLRFTQIDDDTKVDLDLRRQQGNLDEIGQDFWDAFTGLDRAQLFADTQKHLQKSKSTNSIGELALALKPEQDLEAITLWLNLALHLGILTQDEYEQFDLELSSDGERETLRYRVPQVVFSAQSMDDLRFEDVEG